MMRRIGLFLLLALGTIRVAAQAPAPARRMLGAPEQSLVIGEGADIELLSPMSIAPDASGGFYLFDSGERQVLAFDRNGRIRWKFGRGGGGPGEFRAMTDLEVERNGDVVTLDVNNARLTIISSSGQLLRTVPLPGEVRRLLPSPQADQWMLIPHGPFLWLTINATGVTQRQTGLPAGVQFAPDIAGEPFTARTDSGAVIAYRWSSTFVMLRRDGTVRAVATGVEELPFPEGKRYPVKMGDQTLTVTRVDPQAPKGTGSVTSRGSLILTLFGGRTAEKGRLLDRYDALTGRYLGSHLLPHRVNEIAMLSDGRLATIEMDPLPVVRVWNLPAR